MAGIGSAAIAARVQSPTVPQAFAETVAARADAVALRWRVGEHGEHDAAGPAWAEWSWRELADRVASVAASYRSLGVAPGDRIVLLLTNRPEFFVADLAALVCGATPVSIYNSSSSEQIAYLAHHCRASVAVVEHGAYLEQVLGVRAGLPDLRHVVVVEPPAAGLPPGVLTFAELVAAAPLELGSAAGVARPDDLCTVIYTSGTTGPPKGVAIDHANVSWTVESLSVAMTGIDLPGRRVVSYLPLAHIAERMTSYYQGIVRGLQISTCPDASLLTQYLPEVRPEFFFAVPRVWEKAHASLQAAADADADAGFRARFDEALALGSRVDELRLRGAPVPAALAAEHAAADRDVLHPVRELIGLDQLFTALSGAAALPVEVFGFFRNLGVPLSEIYGLSETSGPMTWTPWAVKAGTVGPAIPGAELRLAADGEVLCRGGNIFRGYLDDPARTAEALDAQGWLRTGDIGILDADGYLTIVDRKKELIITAGGKNVSPANLESALKAMPLIGQACAIGDGRAFVSALLVLDPEVTPAWARARGIEFESLEDLAGDARVLAELADEVHAANARFSSAEQVKRWSVLAHEWLPDSEELTPTMKLKRRGIHEKYADVIESMYRR